MPSLNDETTFIYTKYSTFLSLYISKLSFLTVKGGKFVIPFDC